MKGPGLSNQRPVKYNRSKLDLIGSSIKILATLIRWTFDSSLNSIIDFLVRCSKYHGMRNATSFTYLLGISGTTDVVLPFLIVLLFIKQGLLFYLDSLIPCFPDNQWSNKIFFTKRNHHHHLRTLTIAWWPSKRHRKEYLDFNQH